MTYLSRFLQLSMAKLQSGAGAVLVVTVPLRERALGWRFPPQGLLDINSVGVLKLT